MWNPADVRQLDADLAAVDVLLSRLVETAARLDLVAGRAAALADVCDWQSTAATAFHDRVGRWRDAVRGAGALVRAAEDDLRAARWAMSIDAGGAGGATGFGDSRGG